MQYHLEGFRTGDPSVSLERTQVPAGDVDVLIVGCGPAGLTLASQLSVFSDISVRIAERKSGPLEFGQADGIACRSIEMFEAFGFAEKVIKEAYRVNEVSFWRPGSDNARLTRADRIQDVEDDLSEMPHVILSQARVHDFYLDFMAKSPSRLHPDYNRELLSVRRHAQGTHPIEATFACLDKESKIETIRAKYLVGCDGARSKVRAEMGHSLKGQSARQLWGVMDVLPRTNFPDIRLKCAIQSADQGSLLIIPREGGYMVRLYIELDALGEAERAADRNITAEQLIEKARKILQPYEFEVAQVAWWSAYEIGQRLCDAFDDVSANDRGSVRPRLFIVGDACHTHSPKAGQGMNVSMADAFNLGWKLAAVLLDQAVPSVLDTYSEERHGKAKELIEFDKDMARLFSKKPQTKAEAVQFQSYFKKHGRYTAGVETRYGPSILTGESRHETLAEGYVVGKRFHSAPVIRLADAKPMQLGHVLKADGRWRVIAFAPGSDIGAEDGPVAVFCERLSTGLLNKVTPQKADIDALIDLRVVFQQSHRALDITKLHPLLRPTKGSLGLTDYEKVFCPSLGPQDIFDLRRIDREKGALVVVRPDQYVSMVVPVSHAEDIENFFGHICPALMR